MPRLFSSAHAYMLTEFDHIFGSSVYNRLHPSMVTTIASEKINSISGDRVRTPPAHHRYQYHFERYVGLSWFGLVADTYQQASSKLPDN